MPGYSPKGTGFEPYASRPLLGSLSLNGYRSMTGNLNTTKKGTDHPTSLCRWPSIMGVAMCPSATLTSSICHLGLGLILEVLAFEKRYGRASSPSHLVCM